MAAFAGLGIDNAFVRIDAPEVPILDGSAAPFVGKLLAAGIAMVKGRRKQIFVKKTFEVCQGDKFMRVEPSPSLSYECSIDFASAAIGRQRLSFSRSFFLNLCDSLVGKVTLSKAGPALHAKFMQDLLTNGTECLDVVEHGSVPSSKTSTVIADEVAVFN